MKNGLLILGAGGIGKVCYEIAEDSGFYDKINFLDDKNVDEKVLGSISNIEQYKNTYQSAFVAIGDNKLRLELFQKLESIGYEMDNIIHKTAFVSRTSVLCNGILIGPLSVINTGARIGNAVVISAGATIDHDTIILDGCHIDAGVAIKWNRITISRETIKYENGYGGYKK